MIALGRLHEVGVGRILAGKNWPSVAFNLIDHAALIICIPSMRCGTRRELDYIIRNRLLGKTIFLMPSDDRIIFTFRNLRDDWKNVLEYLAPKGIKFPQYSSSGLLFSIDGSGEYIKEELDLTSRRSIREAVVRLVAVGLDGNKIHAVAT